MIPLQSPFSSTAAGIQLSIGESLSNRLAGRYRTLKPYFSFLISNPNPLQKIVMLIATLLKILCFFVESLLSSYHRVIKSQEIGAVNDRPYSYDAASSIFSMNIPYPLVGSLTRTWVTAPTSLPFCKIGLPNTRDYH